VGIELLVHKQDDGDSKEKRMWVFWMGEKNRRGEVKTGANYFLNQEGVGRKTILGEGKMGAWIRVKEGTKLAFPLEGPSD